MCSSELHSEHVLSSELHSEHVCEDDAIASPTHPLSHLHIPLQSSLMLQVRPYLTCISLYNPFSCCPLSHLHIPLQTCFIWQVRSSFLLATIHEVQANGEQFDLVLAGSANLTLTDAAEEVPASVSPLFCSIPPPSRGSSHKFRLCGSRERASTLIVTMAGPHDHGGNSRPTITSTACS